MRTGDPKGRRAESMASRRSSRTLGWSRGGWLSEVIVSFGLPAKEVGCRGASAARASFELEGMGEGGWRVMSRA